MLLFWLRKTSQSAWVWQELPKAHSCQLVVSFLRLPSVWVVTCSPLFFTGRLWFYFSYGSSAPGSSKLWNCAPSELPSCHGSSKPGHWLFVPPHICPLPQSHWSLWCKVGRSIKERVGTPVDPEAQELLQKEIECQLPRWMEITGQELTPTSKHTLIIRVKWKGYCESRDSGYFWVMWLGKVISLSGSRYLTWNRGCLIRLVSLLFLSPELIVRHTLYIVTQHARAPMHAQAHTHTHTHTHTHSTQLKQVPQNSLYDTLLYSIQFYSIPHLPLLPNASRDPLNWFNNSSVWHSLHYAKYWIRWLVSSFPALKF